jgi:hypothetical protein
MAVKAAAIAPIQGNTVPIVNPSTRTPAVTMGIAIPAARRPAAILIDPHPFELARELMDQGSGKDNSVNYRLLGACT